MDYYQKALESWYKEGHPLRLDPLHPLLGMAGEAGELLNLYKKNEYKPNFNWFNCKHCGYGDASHSLDDYKVCSYISKSDENIMRGKYTPFVLDELGDVWYYLRIIGWQQNMVLRISELDWETLDILDLLIELTYYSTGLLKGWRDNEAIAKNYLLNAHEILLAILLKLDYSLEQLTELNYEKLNTADQNGWSSAR